MILKFGRRDLELGRRNPKSFFVTRLLDTIERPLLIILIHYLIIVHYVVRYVICFGKVGSLSIMD